MAARLLLGDAVEKMAEIEDASVDAIICDPPYPMIRRRYGMMTEAEWHDLMRSVVAESRRILRPTGSAVFILQPNCSRLGSMRLWLWEFVVESGRAWNLVEDVYWWNTTALPKCGQVRSRVLPKPAVKPCVWLGDPDCFRDIDNVLAPVSDRARKAKWDTVGRPPSGERGPIAPRFQNRPRMNARAIERGGSTPSNLLAISNGNSSSSGGAHGHGAATPEPLMDWWIRYIVPEGGVVCDPFLGSGTCGLAALKRGNRFVGIERDPGYFAIAERRIAEAEASLPLFEPKTA